MTLSTIKVFKKSIKLSVILLISTQFTVKISTAKRKKLQGEEKHEEWNQDVKIH